MACLLQDLNEFTEGRYTIFDYIYYIIDYFQAYWADKLNIVALGS